MLTVSLLMTQMTALAIALCSVLALFITPVNPHTERFKKVCIFNNDILKKRKTQFGNRDPMEIIYLIKKEEQALALEDKSDQESRKKTTSLMKRSEPSWLVAVPSSTPHSTNFVLHFLTNSLLGKVFNNILSSYRKVKQERQQTKPSAIQAIQNHNTTL